MSLLLCRGIVWTWVGILNFLMERELPPKEFATVLLSSN